jgi:hypothetical protein
MPLDSLIAIACDQIVFHDAVLDEDLRVVPCQQTAGIPGLPDAHGQNLWHTKRPSLSSN